MMVDASFFLKKAYIFRKLLHISIFVKSYDRIKFQSNTNIISCKYIFTSIQNKVMKSELGKVELISMLP
jgi:hypothetical protein